MISAFARMLGQKETLLRVDETPEGVKLHTRTPEGAEIERQDAAGPPERFVQSVQDEAGTVHVSPLVDALRDWLARLRQSPK